jgi:hypothetical protein
MRRISATGQAPKVNRNCIVSAGISFEPSLESSAQAPHESTQSIEYQNHLALNVVADGIDILALPFEEGA